MNICYQCRIVFKLWFIISLLFFLIDFNFVLFIPLLVVLILFYFYTSFGGIIIFSEIIMVIVSSLLALMFSNNLFIILIPFVIASILTLSVRSGKRWIAYFSFFIAIYWLYKSYNIKFNIVEYLYLTFFLFTLLLNIPLLKGKGEKVNYIDIINLDDTFVSNMYINIFTEDLRSSNLFVNNFGANDVSKVKNHVILFFSIRYFFPYFRDITLLIKSLPKGNGRSLFIFYYGKLYLDIAYIPIWIVAILKGYTIKGRYYGICSIKGEPIINEIDIKHIRECSGDFADGWNAGLPIILYPSILFITGALLSFLLL